MWLLLFHFPSFVIPHHLDKIQGSGGSWSRFIARILQTATIREITIVTMLPQRRREYLPNSLHQQSLCSARPNGVPFNFGKSAYFWCCDESVFVPSLKRLCLRHSVRYSVDDWEGLPIASLLSSRKKKSAELQGEELFFMIEFSILLFQSRRIFPRSFILTS